jgi:solute carrier family 25 (mitochondrial folate transporter), member 32
LLHLCDIKSTILPPLPLSAQVAHGAIQFAAYEELKVLASRLPAFIGPLGGGKDSGSNGGEGAGAQPPSQRALSPVEITVCGALSKLTASVATYPSQVVRARLQQRMETRALAYAGAADVVRKTLAREGVRGLYRGLLPNVLRVMPQSALTFLVYETVMNQLTALG